MEKTESLAAFAKAMAEAQKAYKAYKKDSSVGFASNKPGGAKVNYNYGDLAGLFDSVREALAANGIAILQPIKKIGPVATIQTILIHDSGEMISEIWEFQPHQSIKELGSQITYLKRYCLQAILGIASEEDDDDGTAFDENSGGSNKTNQQQKQANDRPQPNDDAITRNKLMWQAINDPSSNFDQDKMKNFLKNLYDVLDPKYLTQAQWEDFASQVGLDLQQGS